MQRSAIWLTLPLLYLLTACSGQNQADEGSLGTFGASGGETGQATGAGNGEGGTAEGDGTTGDGEADTAGEDDTAGESDTTQIKFDVEAVADASPPNCGEQGDQQEPDFSYIFIANSSQGTLSKLNTQTMVEEGRYLTRYDGDGSPSRTSVNLSGDVVVANREGGVTKVYARIQDCKESNGVPNIQTSTNKFDVLAWGEEECIAWFTPFGGYKSQRPVAWTAGTYDEFACRYVNQKVWTSGLQNDSTLRVMRLDGDTGEIEANFPIPNIETGMFGAYGGAVDGEEGFWFMTYVGAPFPLVHVREDLSYEVVDGPPNLHPYGITIDHEGRIWIAGDNGGVGRYDPQIEQWDVVPGVHGLGIQEHPDGYMWMGTYPELGIQAIDVETMVPGPFLPLPEAGGQTKGVSIDFYGKVWLVDMFDSAFRIDPDTLQYDIYDGLYGPYTYSDMTGWGLANVSHPQG